MKTLIKTNNSFILVSDEEIKRWEQYDLSGELFAHYWNDHDKKTRIIVSTATKETYLKQHRKSYIGKVLSQFPKLSKLSQEDKDEIGWIDVEELAKQKYPDKTTAGWKDHWSISSQRDFKAGFQKAQELNQKKYTEEDILNAINFGIDYSAELIQSEKNQITDFLKSISQPQQWSCEATEIDGVWNITKILNI